MIRNSFYVFCLQIYFMFHNLGITMSSAPMSYQLYYVEVGQIGKKIESFTL